MGFPGGSAVKNLPANTGDAMKNGAVVVLLLLMTASFGTSPLPQNCAMSVCPICILGTGNIVLGLKMPPTPILSLLPQPHP